MPVNSNPPIPTSLDAPNLLLPAHATWCRVPSRGLCTKGKVALDNSSFQKFVHALQGVRISQFDVIRFVVMTTAHDLIVTAKIKTSGL